MSTSTRKVTIVYSGDVDGTQEINAASNADSPAAVEIVTLASGSNTITVPTSGTVPTAVTIVPPTDNTTSITLKGVTGDTTAGGVVTGVRLYWS